MDRSRIRLVVLFAQAGLLADVLRRELDSDNYEIVTLDDMIRAEREQDNIFHSVNYHHDDVNIECIIENDDVHYSAQAKQSKCKMPNAQRQYLQKWQPV